MTLMISILLRQVLTLSLRSMSLMIQSCTWPLLNAWSTTLRSIIKKSHTLLSSCSRSYITCSARRRTRRLWSSGRLQIAMLSSKTSFMSDSSRLLMKQRLAISILKLIMIFIIMHLGEWIATMPGLKLNSVDACVFSRCLLSNWSGLQMIKWLLKSQFKSAPTIFPMAQPLTQCQSNC